MQVRQSQNLQQDHNAMLAVPYTAASNELERSRQQKSMCMCSKVTGGLRGHFEDSGMTLPNPCLALLNRA